MKNKFYEAAFDGRHAGTGEVSRQHCLVVADTKQAAKLVLSSGWEDIRTLTLSTPDHYSIDGDQPTTCPDCGVRTEFSEIPGGYQGHQCLGCGYLFTTEFADDERENASPE